MSGPIEQDIKTRIQKAFDPDVLDLVNESHGHNVPKGSESHFKLVCVSDKFAGKNRVQRQREIYSVLSDIMKDKIHALALHTFTPDEWTAASERTLLSPQCSHKSKRV